MSIMQSIKFRGKWACTSQRPLERPVLRKTSREKAKKHRFDGQSGGGEQTSKIKVPATRKRSSLTGRPKNAKLIP